MSEIQFAKQFLVQLSSRPQRIPIDHVQDPKDYGPRIHVALPRLPASKTRRPFCLSSVPTSAPYSAPVDSANAASSQSGVTLHLRSLRPTGPQALQVAIPNVALSTSILQVKVLLSARTSVGVDKLKLLLKGKVLPDAKTVGEVIERGEDEIGVTVMIMGGAKVVMREPGDPVMTEGIGDLASKVETGRKNIVLSDLGSDGDVQMEDVGLDGERFWVDLRVWMERRVGDKHAEEAAEVFRKAWDDRAAS